MHCAAVPLGIPALQSCIVCSAGDLKGSIFRFCRCFLVRSRYTFAFQPHDWVKQDKNNPAYIEKHPYAASVNALVKYLASQLRERGHVIYMDNYFTSATTFRELLDMGHHAVGTMKSTRGELSSLLWKQSKKRPAGMSRFLRSTDRKLVVQEWQDSGLVKVMSTFHTGLAGTADSLRGKPGVEAVIRKRKTGYVYRPLEIPCPPAVLSYQQHMRGVDMADAVSFALHFVCCARAVFLAVACVFLALDVFVFVYCLMFCVSRRSGRRTERG